MCSQLRAKVCNAGSTGKKINAPIKACTIMILHYNVDSIKPLNNKNIGTYTGI